MLFKQASTPEEWDKEIKRAIARSKEMRLFPGRNKKPLTSDEKEKHETI